MVISCCGLLWYSRNAYFCRKLKCSSLGLLELHKISSGYTAFVNYCIVYLKTLPLFSTKVRTWEWNSLYLSTLYYNFITLFLRNKAYEVVKKGWHWSHHHFFSDISVKMKSLKWCFQCLKNHCISIYGYSLFSGFVSLPLNKHSNCRPRKTWILCSYLAPRDSRVMLVLNKIIKCTGVFWFFFPSLGIP